MDKFARQIFHLFVLLGLGTILLHPFSSSLAQVAPITSSGLNTQVSGPISVGSQTQFNITGGTRPGGGTNLYHSFGNFNVPNNNVANFLNNTGLPTANILGRVTGGNISNIFGTIQTQGFGNANLYLMNPAGFLFGSNATVNVGGMVTFTSADYLRLADGAKFTAKPGATADALLSAAPVAAFGFLGSNPGAITVQGSQLTVAEGTGISLVGGNITVQGGTLTAPSGQINLVSVGKPASSHGAEVALSSAGLPTGFKSLGTISLTQGSTVDTSGIAGSGHVAGGVSIRGGQFVMDASSIKANTGGGPNSQAPGNVEVTAEQVALSNHSAIDTSSYFLSALQHTGVPGNITFNVNTFSATDSTISARAQSVSAPSGAVTIQGLQGSGASAEAVSLTNTGVSTFNDGLPTPFAGGTPGGPILIRADNIALNQSHLNTESREQTGGPITLQSKGALEMVNSTVVSRGVFSGPVDLRAGERIDLTNSGIVSGGTVSVRGGTISLVAPVISLSGSSLRVENSGVFGPSGASSGGSITLTGTTVSLTNGTVLSANEFNPFSSGNGGTILINAGGLFTSQQSTLTATSAGGTGGTIQVQANTVQLTDTQLTTSVTNGRVLGTNESFSGNGGTILINGGGLAASQQSTLSATSAGGNGGTIQVQANTVQLTDTQLTTSVNGGSQTVGGTITINGKNTTLSNSQILSTATEGHGGTISINTNVLRQNPSTVIDASSQTGMDGTVTINGVVQP